MPHEPAFLCEHVVVSVTATRLPNDPGVGTLVNGGISVISPKGELVDFVPTHEKYATNICFSGTDMRTVHVTLSTSGKVVTMKWPRSGGAALLPGVTRNW